MQIGGIRGYGPNMWGGCATGSEESERKVLKMDRPVGRRVLRFDGPCGLEGCGLPPLAAINFISRFVADPFQPGAPLPL